MRKGVIHRVLKPESIETLVRRFGAGRSIFIPSSTAKVAIFEAMIGLEQTSRLVDAFGGNTLYLPGIERKNGAYGRPTLAEVRKSDRQGKSAGEQAREFGCSRRTIYNKRRRNRERETGT